MILRGYQQDVVDDAWRALQEKDNTLIVAPTGAGKTIMIAGCIERGIKQHGVGKALVLQHRDELTGQNLKKFKLATDGRYPVSMFDAKSKSFRGRVTFAMVQSLHRNLDRIKNIDLIVIDEAHHAPSRTYLDIIERAREINPNLKLIGVTATPVRGDRKTLNKCFDNVCHVIEISDMIANGYLVPPRTFKPVIPNLRESVNAVRQTATEFDMNEVAAIVDKDVVTDEVLRHWRERAGRLKTIVFCANVSHAEHVAEAFRKIGISCRCLHSKMAKSERRENVAAFERNEFQVLVNVMVATEGFDDQRLECVVILRSCAHRSTFTQIVGRVLRKVDQAIYPGTVKVEGMVLDFCSNHDRLEQDIGEAFIQPIKRLRAEHFKVCPKCLADLPPRTLECSICGHEFPPPEKHEKGTADDVRLIEVNLLEKSRLSWVDLFANGKTLMASGFKAWGLVVQADRDRDLWFAFGSLIDKDGVQSEPRVLDMGKRIQCVAAARDWIGTNETNAKASKVKEWVGMPATDKQRQLIGRFKRFDPAGEMNRYSASCKINYLLNERRVINIVNHRLQ